MYFEGAPKILSLFSIFTDILVIKDQLHSLDS